MICQACGGHNTEECQALVRCGYTRDMFNLVLPIRFGLLQLRDPDMFDWLMQSMDHTAERNKNEEMRQSTDRMTSLLSSALSNVSKELAWKIVGILFTNCFEFNIRDIDARALYPLVSLVNHSCIPNMRHTNLLNNLETLKNSDDDDSDEDGEIVVMQLEAQRTILPGTELSIRYNDYMMVFYSYQA